MCAKKINGYVSTWYLEFLWFVSTDRDTKVYNVLCIYVEFIDV